MSGKKAFIMGNGTIIDSVYKKGTVIGNSEIFGGTFKKLRIMGNSEITGVTDIDRLSVMGTLDAKERIRVNMARLAGQCSFEMLEARHIIIRMGNKNSETYELKGNINAELMELLTKCRLEGSVNIKNYIVSGMLSNDEEICCESFICPGIVKTPSINASCICIYPRASSAVKELYGSKIAIQRDFSKSFASLHGRYSMHKHARRAGQGAAKFEVDTIEADEIYIEYTNAMHVSGKNVVIGPGCNISRLDYIEAASTAPDSIVGAIEKI